MRHALTLVAVWALAAPPASAQPEPAFPLPVWRVEPGLGIGPYRLDLGLEGLLARIGRAGAERMVVDMAEATRRCRPKARGRVLRFTWRQEGLWLTADADTGAVRVLSAFGTSGPFVTDRGVRLGDPADRVQARYGTPPQTVDCDLPRGVRARVLRYTTLGVQFTTFDGPVPHAGRVLEMGVFRLGVF
ncbi:MAG: hypothetical protein RMM30_09195 [Armatimonadota bacterium]|nr:hypothetical protein [Armatimonadota bacterium]MDW8156745.1 hypothetical protein [Armatimonadota bacterium]